MANALFEVDTGLQVGGNYWFSSNGNIVTTGTVVAGNIQVTGATSITNINIENTVYQQATNLSSGNAWISGGAIGVQTDGTVSPVANVYTTTGFATNFSTGNARITGGSLTGTTGAFSTLVATNFSSGNSRVTGGFADNFPIGANTAAPGAFTTLSATGVTTLNGNLTVNGNVTITGNTTTINQNDLSINDAIINLHSPDNLSPLTSNDGKDIGIKFHYFDTADSHAFIGRTNSNGFLDYWAKGTEGVGNVFNGTNRGTIRGGELVAANGTASTSTTTGDVRVSGGVGIGNGLYVNGTSWFQNASTANIFITGGSVTGITGAATVFVADAFSSANIYQTGTSQSIQTANAQIGTDWGTTSRANLVVGNISVLNATTGNVTTSYAQNFSAANVYQLSYTTVGSAGWIQTGNAQIGTNWGGLSRANLAVGNVGVLNATTGNVTTSYAQNFSAANIYQLSYTTVGAAGWIQTGNAQIGTNWDSTSRANLAVGNIGVLNATTGNVTTLYAQNLSGANIYQLSYTTVGAAGWIQTGNAQIGTNWDSTSRANLAVGNIGVLNATTGNVTTAYAANFSAANIYQLSYTTVGAAGWIQTGNAQIGTNWGGLARANLAVGNIGVLNATTGNVTTLYAANFWSPNVSATGASSGIGAYKTSATSDDWTVASIGNVYSTYGQFTNFSSGNINIPGGTQSFIGGGVGGNGGAIANVYTSGVGNFGSAISANVTSTGFMAYTSTAAAALTYDANYILPKQYTDVMSIVFGT